MHVSINQFYGIEINDFAVTVAQTAMWIAECKMMEDTNRILSKNFTPLPLTDSAKIVEGNALRMEWPKADYIMGNPPFIGARNKSPEQAADVESVFPGWKNVGNLDYVTCWYKKTNDIMKGTATRAAFVSTNSICQGDGVAILWKPLFAEGLEIDFAWRTFVWDSEALDKAHVHVVIVGFHAARSESAPYRSGVGDGRANTPGSPQSEIEKTAHGILDVRALYPDSSLADLYDPLTMPPELRKAHAANDAAVMRAYGFPPDLTEQEIVSRLFEMYAKLTEK